MTRFLRYLQETGLWLVLLPIGVMLIEDTLIVTHVVSHLLGYGPNQ